MHMQTNPGSSPIEAAEGDKEALRPEPSFWPRRGDGPCPAGMSWEATMARALHAIRNQPEL